VKPFSEPRLISAPLAGLTAGLPTGIIRTGGELGARRFRLRNRSRLTSDTSISWSSDIVCGMLTFAIICNIGAMYRPASCVLRKKIRVSSSQIPVCIAFSSFELISLRRSEKVLKVSANLAVSATSVFSFGRFSRGGTKTDKLLRLYVDWDQ
jgi:hypothetical protein